MSLVCNVANIVAYHFSTSLPRVPAHSVLPARSRLSAPSTGSGQAAPERPGLIEFLRELAFEKSLCLHASHTTAFASQRPLHVSASHLSSFRIGLAATPWQLQQSLDLLQRQGLQSPLLPTSRAGAHDVDLDRVVALAMNTSINSPFTGALATIWLRRDGVCGLPQDRMAFGHQALDHMRASGKRLIAVEALAFDEHIPLDLVLEPMMRALKSIAVDLWDASDIVTSCPRSQVAYYCSKLGFARVQGQVPHASHAAPVLLHTPTQRMAQKLEQARVTADDTEALSA